MTTYFRLLKERLIGCLQSMVIWFNTTAAILVPVLEYAKDNFPMLREFLPANLYAWAFGGVLLTNILLRFRTSIPLEDKPIVSKVLH